MPCLPYGWMGRIMLRSGAARHLNKALLFCTFKRHACLNILTCLVCDLGSHAPLLHLGSLAVDAGTLSYIHVAGKWSTCYSEHDGQQDSRLLMWKASQIIDLPSLLPPLLAGPPQQLQPWLVKDHQTASLRRHHHQFLGSLPITESLTREAHAEQSGRTIKGMQST